MTDSLADFPEQPRVRVIALGDEVLAGAGDAKAMGWLGRAVAKHNDGADAVDLYRAAMPHETTLELAQRWEQDVQRMRERDPKLGTQHRVVLGLGSADISAGISLARSRLNLATVLDGVDHVKIPVFVVGPIPSKDRSRTQAIADLSRAYHDVCARRRIPYVDPVGALRNHDQFMADISRSDRDLPSQVGYGLITWLVLHGEFSQFLSLS